MPRGPRPKSEEERQRRNIVENRDVILDVPEDTVYGFDLPYHPNIRWCQLTKDWWAMWRTSPQARLMVTTDWWSLMVAAVAHNEVFRIRQPTERPLTATNLTLLMGELRRRESQFGATWEDRRRNRLVIRDPDTEEMSETEIRKEANKAVDYLSKLNAAVSEQQNAQE